MNELEERLSECKEQNRHLMNKINELNEIVSFKCESPVADTSTKDGIEMSLQKTPHNTQNLIAIAREKEQQHVYEVKI